MFSVVDRNLYYSYIKNYACPLDNSFTEDKIQAVVNKFFELLEINTNVNRDKLKKMMSNIASLKPGFDLLNKIASTDIKINVASGEFSKYHHANNSIFVNFDEKYFYVSLNSDNEKILVEGPIDVVVAHELMHEVAAVKDVAAAKMLHENKCDLLDPEMSNANEQQTITGFSKVTATENLPFKIMSTNLRGESAYFAITNQCCENSILVALGLPIRINHCGPLNSPPTPTDFVRVGAIGSLREILQNDPLKINYIEFNQEADAKISLLSAAGYYKQKTILEFLLSKHIDIHIQDEIGGPILAAIKNGHHEFAISLIDLGLDIRLKDSDQKTALDYVHSFPSWRFSKPHNLLIDKLEKAEQSLNC